MKIKELLEHFEQKTENVIKIEDENPYLENYIFTKKVIRNFKKLLNFINNENHSGINLYGNFGTGKSHFINVLNYLSKNDKTPNIPSEIKNLVSEFKIYKFDLSLHTNFENISEILSEKILKDNSKKSADQLLNEITKLNQRKKTLIILDELEAFSKIKNISLEIQGFIHASETITPEIKFIFITQNKFEKTNSLKNIKNRISLEIDFDDENIEEVLLERVLKKKNQKIVKKIYQEEKQNILLKTPELNSKFNYHLNDENKNEDLFYKFHPLQPYILEILMKILENNYNLSNRTLIYSVHKIIKDKYLEKTVDNWINLIDIYDIISENKNDLDLYKIIYILEKTYFPLGVPLNNLSKFMYKSYNENIEKIQKNTESQLKKLLDINKIYIDDKKIRISNQEIENLQKLIAKKINNIQNYIPLDIILNYFKKNFSKKFLKNFSISFNHENIMNNNKKLYLEIFYNIDEMKLRRQALKTKEKIFVLLDLNENFENKLKELKVITNLDKEKYSDIGDFIENRQNNLLKNIKYSLNQIFDNSKIIYYNNKPFKGTNFKDSIMKIYKNKIEKNIIYENINIETKKESEDLESLIYKIKKLKLVPKNMEIKEEKNLESFLEDKISGLNKKINMIKTSKYKEIYIFEKYKDYENINYKKLKNLITDKNSHLEYIISNIKNDVDRVIKNNDIVNSYNVFMENLNYESIIYPNILEYLKDMRLHKVEKEFINEKDIDSINYNYSIFKNTFETLWKNKFEQKIILEKFQSNYKNISLHDLI